ncbi:MAG: 23S rRNA (adenine(2503)-C(2))-methyltransferase RlmN [Gammaproteobacteria bacterium]
MEDRINLLDLDRKAMIRFFADLGEKPFRANQVLKWIHQAGVSDLDQMTNLSKTLRAKLQDLVCIEPPKIKHEQISKDGTRKWLLEIDGFNSVETVFIPENSRGTLCVSSQVGCPLDCKFCSTGQQGFNKNLTVGEIIGQVWQANKQLGWNSEGRQPITNVVMMGMGEPMMNFDNVVSAMDLMMDDFAYGLSRRRVTLSTSGIVPAIDQLKLVSPVSLAISLHAPNNEIREKIMPINKTYSIEKLLEACRRFTDVEESHNHITFEYVMLDGINDSIANAHELVKRLRGIPSKVNLIPFNPFPGSEYKCSSKQTIDRFRAILIESGLVAVTRKTRGDDIDAACGQLAGQVTAKAERFRRDSPKGSHGEAA